MDAHPAPRLAVPAVAARRGGALALAAAVLAAHAALLLPLLAPDALAPRKTPPGPLREPAAVQVRQRAADAAPAPTAHAGMGATATTAAPPQAQAAAAPAVTPVSAAPQQPADPPPAPGAPAIAGDTAPRPPAAAPPAATLQFDTRHGERVGRAELRWLPDDDGRYRLELAGVAPGRPQLAWISEGVVEGGALAPQRYVESRRGRDRRAVNFRRDAGRISFSGPTHELPLPEGAQDPLSWLLQLAALLRADPALARPGQRLALPVAGPRGELESWAFEVLGELEIDSPAGPRRVLHLLRRPQRAWDLRAELWLDPAQHWLPLRMHWQWHPDGPGTWFERRTALPE